MCNNSLIQNLCAENVTGIKLTAEALEVINNDVNNLVEERIIWDEGGSWETLDWIIVRMQE